MSALDPRQQRCAFTDALRPPPGYVLGACIGTTYRLDFDPFTAVVLAFVGADLDDSLHSPPAVLTTIARLRSRLRVYVNSGGLLPPKVPSRLFALYDRVLRPVHVPDAAFHPKVWVLRFDPASTPEHRNAPSLYRVLCASRNVTDSGCWELAVTLNGRLGTTRQQFGDDVAKFCRRFSGRDLPKEIWKLLGELPRVEFERGREAMRDMRFEWQWPRTKSLASSIPKHAQQAIVISPFIRADFLKALRGRIDDLVIVSTQKELDALPEEAHEDLTRARTYVVTGADVEDIPNMDLHAKLIAWESDRDSETSLGSANATGPGWGLRGRSNCEAMVALRPGLKVDDIVRSFVAPSKGELHAWIEEYSRQPVEPSEEEDARAQLDWLRRTLCSDQVSGTYDRSARALILRCAIASPRQPLPGTVTAEIVPLLQRDTNVWASYPDIYRKGARFTNIELEDLSGFALVRLRDSRFEDVQIVFGIQFELPLNERDSEERDDAVNARLLEGVDARALLMSVLSGMPAGTWMPPVKGRNGGGSAGPNSLLRYATIERVLEVCTADPSRMDEVDAVLRACGRSEDLVAFREFWQVFREAFNVGGERV